MIPPGAVPFAAKGLARALCVYVNADYITEDAALRDYAFAVPSEIEHESDFTSNAKTFFAERYGGDGIGEHGGAGRCGTTAEFQIKGIGRTPLIGGHLGEDGIWHTHGGMACMDAIREAIWGEVFSYALPHGAVRVVAIILTGTDCWFEGPRGERATAPRALVVREVAIRPAHFFRAVYFRPNPALGLESDASRVKRAVNALPEFLPPTNSVGRVAPIDHLIGGLAEMASRMASQCAAAQSRRLLHGTLNGSNIGLDGRWIDYGTATLLPTYANAKSYGAPRQFATLWEEQTRPAAIIDQFCFYINKYFAFPRGGMRILSDALKTHYWSSYDSALMMSHLRMLGLPDDLLKSVAARPESVALARELMNITRGRNRERIEPASHESDALERNILGNVLIRLARNVECGDPEVELSELLPDSQLRERLCNAYEQFFGILCQSEECAGISRKSLTTMAALKAAKLTRSFDELIRQEMAMDNYRIVQHALKSGEWRDGITGKIERLRDIAATLYSSHDEWDVLAWQHRDERVWFMGRREVWRSEYRGGHLVSKNLDPVNPALVGMLKFWGDYARWFV